MINSFRGSYSFLSNMAPVTISWEGIEYPSTEHAYAASKYVSQEIRKKISLLKSPVAAKHFPRDNPQYSSDLDPFHKAKRVGIMLELLRLKFNIPWYRDLLLNTKNEQIVEGNYWHDNFWGKCTCMKCAYVHKWNNLGFLLMHVRREVAAGKELPVLY